MICLCDGSFMCSCSLLQLAFSSCLIALLLRSLAGCFCCKFVLHVAWKQIMCIITSNLYSLEEVIKDLVAIIGYPYKLSFRLITV
jgi:hypothetical protein